MSSSIRFEVFHGITHRFQFFKNKTSVSVEVWSKATSERVAVIDDISSLLRVSSFPIQRGSEETLKWFLEQGYSVRWNERDGLTFTPGLPGGGGDPSTSTPFRSSKELSQAIRNANPVDPSYHSRVEQAINMIEAYSQRTVKTPELLQEITILAQSGNAQICHEILKIIFSQLVAAPLLDLPLLMALRDTLRSTNPQYLNPDDLVKILKVLREKHQCFHIQETTLPKLYQLIYVLSGTLDVMGDVNVKQLSYDNLHDPLYKNLVELSKHEDWRIATQAAYARESLLRLGHDKTKLMLFLNSALDFGCGLNSLKQGILGKDPNALMEAYQRFQSAVHTQKKKQRWYEDIRLLIILIENGEFNTFKAHVLSTISQVPVKERALYFRSVLLVLCEFISGDSNEELRVKAIKFVMILCLEDRWGLEKKKKKQKLMPLIQTDVLAQFKAWASEPSRSIASESKKALEQFDGASSIPLAEDFFKRAKVNTPSVALIEETKARPKNVPEHLQRLQQEYVSNEEIKKLLITYIAPQGHRRNTPEETFSLAEEVKKFVGSDKKVLLLLGGSGSGKTTFGRYLAYHFWKEWQVGQPIALFIPPSTLINSDRAIEETLKRHGFSKQQILQIKQEERLIIFCDGYDELGKKQNLYHLHRVSEWNAQLIIACRPEYLGENDLSLVAPLRDDAPQASLIQELHVAPFSDTEIDAYLRQYLEHSPSSPWKEVQEYQRYIKEIPGLRDLISTPFLLYIIADILPDIVQTHKSAKPNQQLQLLQRDLYDAFVAKWFYRAEVRLRKANQVPNIGGDIKISFLAFCKKLAARMFAAATTVVTYTPPVWGEEESPWEEFFGDKDPLPALRSAAPLQQVGPNMFAFLHKSLFDYFNYREGIDQLMGSVLAALPSKALSTEGRKGKEPIKTLPSNLPANFGTKLLVDEPAILQFYVDAVLSQPSFRELLLAIVEESKTDSARAIAAANSMTILNAARVPFSGMDLSKIQIPGANLEGGIFDGTNLEGANLKRVVLSRAFLRDCNLMKSQMKDVQFGEDASFKSNSYPACMMALSPDRQWMAIGDTNYQIRILEAKTKKIITVLIEDHPLVFYAFSPNGRALAVVTERHLGIWDIQSGQLTESLFERDMDMVRKGKAYFERNVDRMMTSISNRTELKVDEMKSSEVLPFVRCLTEKTMYPITSCTFSPDGQYLALIRGLRDGREILLWSFEKKEFVFGAEVKEGDLLFCAFSPDGCTLAASSSLGTIHVWNIAPNQPLRSQETPELKMTVYKTLPNKQMISSGCLIGTLRGHQGKVPFCSFSPDGKMLVSGGEDRTIRSWDFKKGDPLAVLPGHTTSITCGAFSPNDSRYLASGSEDGTLYLWDIQSREMMGIFGGGHTSKVTSCVFLDKQLISLSSSENTICSWDLNQKTTTKKREREHLKEITQCAFSPDGKKIVSVSYDQLCLWDVQSGKKANRLRGRVPFNHYCTFSPDNTFLAEVGVNIFAVKERCVNIWDLRIGALAKMIKGPWGKAGRAVFSSPDRLLVPGVINGDEFRIWCFHFKTGKLLTTLQEKNKAVWCALSPNGQFIAFKDKKQVISIYSHEGERLVLSSKTTELAPVAFSPDHQLLVLKNLFDHSLHLWDPKTGKLQLKLTGHESRVFFCTFSSDSRQLISLSDNEPPHLWNVATGELIGVLDGHRGEVKSCAFSPDDEYIVSGGSDRAVRIWKKCTSGYRLISSTGNFLTAIRANFNEAQELSEMNSSLLEQHGAKTHGEWWEHIEKHISVQSQRLEFTSSEILSLLEKLCKDTPDVYNFLQICAYLNPQRLDFSLIDDWLMAQTKMSSEQREECVAQLIQSSLLCYDQQSKFFTIPSQLQSVLQNEHKERGLQREKAHEAAKLIGTRLKEFDKDDHETWKIGRECYPHVDWFIEHQWECLDSSVRFQLLNVTAYWLLEVERDYQKALAFGQKAHDLAQSFSDENSKTPIADSLEHMGESLFMLGEKEKGINLLERVLNLKKEMYGDKPHLEMTKVLQSLGWAQFSCGNTKEALRYFQQAMNIKREIYAGKPHITIATSLNALGMAQNKLGNKEEAQRCYLEALRMGRQVYGERPHFTIVSSLNSLGLAWDSKKNHQTALNFFNQALNMQKEMYEMKPQTLTATLLSNIGFAYRGLKDARAISYLHQALAMKKAIHGEKPHSSMVTPLVNLGLTLRESGKYTEAVECYQQALAMKKALNNNKLDLSIAATLNDLGLCLCDVDRYEEAVKCHMEALSIRKEMGGDLHPTVAISLNNLGIVPYRQKRYREAIKFYEQALDLKKKIYKDKPHQSIVNALINLADAWDGLKQTRKAEAFRRQATEMKKKL